MHSIAHGGAAAAFAGGLLWLAVTVHGFAAHGLTTVNERRLVLGMTWMDSGKLLVASFLLFAVAAVAVYARLEHPRGLDRAALVLTLVALAALAVGTALQFWLFPWGSYEGEAKRFTEPIPSAGGAVQAAASLVLTVGLALFAWRLVRSGVLRWWGGVALALSAPAAFFLTPPFPLTGLAWMAVGLDLAQRPSRLRPPELGLPSAPS